MLLSVEVLDFFGVPRFGGNVTALCHVRIGEELSERAGGDPVAFAARVRETGGAVRVDNGPRSAAIAPPDRSGVVAVPLAIPPECGTYDIEIDAVVELKFWASWLGFSPVCLRVERSADGSLDATVVATGQRFRAEAGALFAIPHPHYGTEDTERAVEIPWVLSRYRGERRVLDVGYAFAEPRYREGLAALRIPALVGLDLAVGPGPALRLIADVRRPALRAGTMGLILAVSVVEHIGRDNSVYFTDRPDTADAAGDRDAVRALAALLAPGGRLLLTVPFGEAQDHGWFVQYDAERLHALVAASGLTTTEAEYYEYRGGWRGPVAPPALAGRRYGEGAKAASGVACLTLTRQ